MGKLITASVINEGVHNYNITSGNQYNLSADGSTPYRNYTYWIGSNNEYDIMLLSYLLHNNSTGCFEFFKSDILLIAPFAYGYKLGTTTSGMTSSGSESWSYTYVADIGFTKYKLSCNNKPVHPMSWNACRYQTGEYPGTFRWIGVPGTDRRIVERDRYTGMNKYFSRIFAVPANGYWDGGSDLPWKFNLSAFSNTTTPGGSYWFAIVYYEMYIKNVTTGEEKTFKSWLMANTYSQRYTPAILYSGGTPRCGGSAWCLPDFGYSQTIKYSIRLLDWQYDNSTIPEILNRTVATNQQITTGSSGELNHWIEYSFSGGEGGTYYLSWDLYLPYNAPTWRVEVEYYVKSDPDHAQDDRVVYDRNGGNKYKLTWPISGSSNPGSTITYDEARFPYPYRTTPREFTLGIMKITISCTSSMASTWGFTSSRYVYDTEFFVTIYQYLHSASSYPWILSLGPYNNKTINIKMSGHG